MNWEMGIDINTHIYGYRWVNGMTYIVTIYTIDTVYKIGN